MHRGDLKIKTEYRPGSHYLSKGDQERFHTMQSDSAIERASNVTIDLRDHLVQQVCEGSSKFKDG